MPPEYDTDNHANDIVNDVLALFREQPDYESISYWEHDIVHRIAYVSAIAQAEKVMPPEGWDRFGR